MLREFWDWYVNRQRIYSITFTETNPSPKMMAGLGLIYPEIGVENLPEILQTSLLTSFSLLTAVIQSDTGLSKVDEIIVGGVKEFVEFWSLIPLYS